MQRHEGLYRGILQNQEFILKLKKLLARRVEAHIQRNDADLEDPAFPIELAAHHMVVSLVGLIEWWLEEDLPLPVEEMARVYKRLIIQATWYALSARNELPMPERQEH